MGGDNEYKRIGIYRQYERNQKVKYKASEVATEYTQVYDILLLLLRKVDKAVSIKLFMFLLSEMTTNGHVFVNKSSCAAFNQLLIDGGSEPVSRQWLNECVKELVVAGLMFRLPGGRRGEYMINPHVAWKGDLADRVEFLKSDLISGSSQWMNPLEMKKPD